MKSVVYKYHCKKCDCLFKSPGLSGELYGEFIMRSERTDEPAYLNALEDKVFKEVGELFDSVIKCKVIGNLDDTDIFQSIFSISCDKAGDGSLYQIGLLPMCPNCGLREMAHWVLATPPEYKEIKIVTHEYWEKLTNEEKSILVGEAIDNYIKRHNQQV